MTHNHTQGVQMARRGFLGAMLAAAAAPAFVKAGILMPVRDTRMILWGDGIHDDTAALQAAIDGASVKLMAAGAVASSGLFLGFSAKISDTLLIRREGMMFKNIQFIGDGMADKPMIQVVSNKPVRDYFGPPKHFAFKA